MRNSISVALILAMILISISLAHSFESDRGSGGPPDTGAQCWNGIDDDQDGNAPPSPSEYPGPYDEDPGCVNPYWEDENEGMIYDTHFTATMEGLSTNNGLFNPGTENFSVDQTESLFFENKVKVGSELDTVVEESDTAITSDNKTLKYVDAQRTESESEEAYAFGFLNSTTISVNDFNSYTSLSDGSSQDVHLEESENRFIDTPHNKSEVCGNGEEDSASDQDTIDDDNNPMGDEAGYTEGDFIDCRADYGRLLLKYDMDSNEDDVEHNYGNEDLECNDDDGDAEASTTSASCGSCGGSGGSGDGDCVGDKEDYSDSEGTNYYENPGDLIEEYECTKDSSCGGTGATSGCDDYDSSSYIPGCSSSSCSCGKNCTTNSYSSRSSNTQYCGQGDIRSWSGVQDSINTDDKYSVVDGGSRINDQRLGNDPAATYTKFTSYADNSWEDSDNYGSTSDDTPQDWVEGSGKVWGGYDFAATINADGPQGNGNGFIVINELAGSNSNDIDRVVGRESPNGEPLVGRNVHYGVRQAGQSDGSATEVLAHDMIDEVDLSCSGTKQICIKYVDYWVTGPGGDGIPGSPTWTIAPSNANSPSKSEISNAINVDAEEYTLDQSYSVCKAANRIAEKNPESISEDINWDNNDGSVRGELVDCDYMREDGGTHNNISPLPEACGDEADEHLMVMEGPSVDSDTAEQWLGHEQECVSWESGEVDDNGRSLDSSACVNQGEAWAEGTVMNVASENFVNDDYPDRGYPYTEEGWEEGGDSPDWQVCLDIDDYVEEDAPKPYNHRYNDPDNDHYGGQWYDLDDERINSYLRDVERDSNGFTAGSISSSDAGGASADDAGGSEPHTWIDYYYTENLNPQHDDYNPKGGMEGTALISNCGSGINCGDDADNVRGHDSGNFFAFSDPDSNTFDRWSRVEDYNPQGRWSRNYNEELDLDYSITSDRPEDSRQQYDESFIEPRDDFIGYLVEARSASDQLGDDHPDFDNHEWWYDTYVNEDRAVQFGYAEGPDWGVDSTGVAYPPGGQSYSTGYVVSGDAEAGNFRHIDAENTPRTSLEDDSISKTDKAHGNSILVVANDDNDHGFDEGQAYWIDPDDITREWHLDNIDRAYW